MKKELIAIGLSCLVAVCSITGCGGNSNTAQSDGKTENTVEEEKLDSQDKGTTESNDVSTDSGTKGTNEPESSSSKQPSDTNNAGNLAATQPRCKERTAYIGNTGNIYYSDTFTYDDKGRVIKIQRYLPNNQDTLTTYEAGYDDKGNIVHEYQQYVVGNKPTSLIFGPFDYTYDEQGNWVKREYKGGDQDVVTSENTYEDGVLTYRHLVFEDRGEEGEVVYNSVEDGRQEYWYYEGAIDWSILYDNDGRLLNWQMGNYFWQSYEYDNQGNPTYIFQSDGGFIDEKYYITNNYDDNNVVSEAYYLSQNDLPDLKVVYSYENYESSDNKTAPEEDPFARYSTFENCNLTVAHQFSNGLAWIEFTDQDSGVEYTGCIDQKGDLKLYMEKTHKTPVPFNEKGISLLRTDDNSKTISIDQKGNINNAIETDSTCLIQEDYGLFVKTESGFDVNQTTYQIYAPDGSLVKEIVDNPENPFAYYNYHGNGIFTFTYENMYITNLYFAKNDKYVENQVCSLDVIGKAYTTSRSYTGKYLLYFCGEYNDVVELTITDDKGNWKDIVIPEEFGDNPIVQDCSERYILLRNNRDFYYVYDVDQDVFKKVDGKYTDRLYWESTPYDVFQVASCSDEAIAILLEGQDGESYIGLYDPETMELLCDPIKGNNALVINKYVIVSSRYINSVDVYDLSGKRISTFSDSPSISYSDGIYNYYDNSTNHFFAGYNDETFNNLFQNGINYSGAKHINLNNQ